MINVSELDKNIKKLVQYGINSGLIPESERNYSTNMILDAFGKDDYSDPDISGEEINLDNILDNLLDIACEMKLIEDSITYRDLFDTKLMNFIMPRPSQVFRKSFGKNIAILRKKQPISTMIFQQKLLH